MSDRVRTFQEISDLAGAFNHAMYHGGLAGSGLEMDFAITVSQTEYDYLEGVMARAGVVYMFNRSDGWAEMRIFDVRVVVV